jgi:uncharacterized protein YhaN
MDSSSVLLALEEQKRWRARWKRIRDRIRQLERRRTTLRKELAGVRDKILESRALFERRLASPTVTMFPPTSPGR